MYYIVEILRSTKMRSVARAEDLDHARRLAYSHSARCGVIVEIQDEFGKVVDKAFAWSESDY